MKREHRHFGCAAVAGAIALGAVFLFFDRHLRWRGQFTSEGRAYDPVDGTVFVEQAGYFWGGCFTLFALAAIAAFLVGWRARRARAHGEESWDERARRSIFGEDGRS